MNNKMKEIKRDGGNGMKERMNKSADCMGGGDGTLHHRPRC